VLSIWTVLGVSVSCLSMSLSAIHWQDRTHQFSYSKSMLQKPTNRASDYRSDASSGARKSHYDGFSIFLHWSTAILVLTQFGLAHTWGFTSKPERHVMIVTHMSFGILLTVLLTVRIIWRAMPTNRVLPIESGMMKLAAKAVHSLLYGLLIAEAILGFVLRWSGNEAMSFFGLLGTASACDSGGLAKTTTRLWKQSCQPVASSRQLNR
jgi:cytochrome b561